jgi:hypothetical protein
MDETFSSDAFTEYSTKLSEKERMLLPLSFEDIIITNIDDAFIFAENIEQLLVCLKLVLMVARDAKLKFSVEKSVFVTTKLQVAGYDFDTKNAALTMDKLKSSAILNMKRPNSLNELHNRICVFSYHSAFLPYLKHVLYPLNHLIKVGKFKWTSVEEEAWMSAKELCSLNLRLTIPDAEDDLVLATDASRIAASACLFRVKHGKLEFVSVNSKYFSVTDMTKCSYVLESIALAYGLKMCASYILNCKGTVKLFTDNRSLTYAKRETKRSIMVNSVLNYIQNFLSTANIEIYHLPGQLNICADVFSRAISENLNCSILKEHPISKKWASVLPPIPDNFSVDNETLFKFLTSPLKSEIQDTHNKTHRKLAEPRTVQTWFDMTSEASSEQRFNEALNWLKKWNLDYTREQREIKEIRGNLDMQKKRACINKIQEILNSMYGDIKNSPIYKKVKSSLLEATHEWMKVRQKRIHCNNLETFDRSVTNVCQQFMELVYDDEGIQQELKDAENLLEEELRDRKEIEGAFLSNGIRVTYMLQNNNGFHPRINSLYNLEIPLQERLIFEPNEIKKVDLGIKLGIPKGYMGIVMSSMEAPFCIKGPMEVLYNTKKDFFQVAFQNVSDSKIVLEGGTMISQIAVKKCDISNCKLEWNELESRFDDTCNEETEDNGQCNDDGVNIEYCWIENNDELDSIRKGLGIINPDSYGIGFLKINLCDEPYGNHDLFTFMQSCERDHISLLERSSSRFESKLPLIHKEYF